MRNDAAAGGGERVAGGERGSVDVELGAVDGAQRAVQPEAFLAVLLGLPGLQMAQHHRGECLMDLVEVEVLQSYTVAGQQPGNRIGRSHQQAVLAVDVIDRSRLGVDEVGQRCQRMGLRPFLAGQQYHRGAVGQRCRVTGGHGGVTSLDPEHRPQRSQFLRR